MRILNFIIMLPMALLGAEVLPEVRTTAGKVYRQAKVLKVTDAEVRIMHEAGTAAIPLEELPEELRERFGYDPAKAKEERAKREEVEAARVARLQALAERKEKVPKLQGEEVKPKRLEGDFLVVEVLEEGALVVNVVTIAQGTALQSIGGGGRVATKRVPGKTLYLIEGAKGVVDGEPMRGTFEEVGTFTLERPLEVKRTMRRLREVRSSKSR